MFHEPWREFGRINSIISPASDSVSYPWNNRKITYNIKCQKIIPATWVDLKLAIKHASSPKTLHSNTHDGPPIRFFAKPQHVTSTFPIWIFFDRFSADGDVVLTLLEAAAATNTAALVDKYCLDTFGPLMPLLNSRTNVLGAARVKNLVHENIKRNYCLI